MANKGFFNRRQEQQQRRERRRAEKTYAKEHADEVEVVQPETRAEMRLTKRGKFELGSNGQLTEKGKTDRLAHRYNWAIIWVLVLTIAVYLFFFLVK
ncbi:hypothetical protein PT274_00885 [Leuconostocaceae bacterium ESL0958]|nr:hypothetical protein [Leuconostocaceae bacterium ESL0958]